MLLAMLSFENQAMLMFIVLAYSIHKAKQFARNNPKAAKTCGRIFVEIVRRRFF